MFLNISFSWKKEKAPYGTIAEKSWSCASLLETTSACLLFQKVLGVDRYKIASQKSGKTWCSQKIMHKPVLNGRRKHLPTPLLGKPSICEEEPAPPCRPCERTQKWSFPAAVSPHHEDYWPVVLSTSGMTRPRTQDPCPRSHNQGQSLSSGPTQAEHHLSQPRSPERAVSPWLDQIRMPLSSALSHSACVRIKNCPLTQPGDCESPPGESLNGGKCVPGKDTGFQPPTWERPLFHESLAPCQVLLLHTTSELVVPSAAEREMDSICQIQSVLPHFPAPGSWGDQCPIFADPKVLPSLCFNFNVFMSHGCEWCHRWEQTKTGGCPAGHNGNQFKISALWCYLRYFICSCWWYS